MHPLRHPLVRTALALALGSAALRAAPVPPNPNSLLKNKRVLVLTGQSGSHAQARTNAATNLTSIKTAVGFATLTTADGWNLNAATLNNFDLVVFNYFFETQLMPVASQNALKAWLAAGNKGYVGYHTSGANQPGEWDWYRDSVTSMRYQVHSGAAQAGNMTRTTDANILNQPIMQGLPATFNGTDEWYDFDLPPRAPAALTWADCKVMYYLDESSLGTPLDRPMNPHPMAWYRQDGRGNRYFYAGFIHTPQGVSTDFFQSVVLRGMEYVAGYTSTPITAHGASIRTWKNLSFITASRELRVDLNDPYRLSVWSPGGKRLYAAEGNTPQSFAPPTFSQPGLYVVKLESPATRLVQRMMVY